MAWLAVDKNGTEVIFDSKPQRSTTFWKARGTQQFVKLSQGTIKKLLDGKTLTWNDEPIKV